MVEYTGREVLLKDENGEVIIPYVSYASSGRNIGDIFYTTRLDTELNGAVECNGGTYDTSDFSGNQSIGNLLNGGKVPYVSLSEYASIVSSNGSCRAFGWDGGDSFRVPLLNDVYIEAGIASSAGEFIKESLPNITGDIYAGGAYGSSIFTSSSGAMQNDSNSGWRTSTVQNTVSGASDRVSFDASRSSSTYQNGAKVKPDSVRYRAMVQLAIKSTEDAVITDPEFKLDVLMNSIYPVGSIYIGTQSVCPMSALITGSVWELIDGDRVLQSSSSSNVAGSTIEAGLPNITGEMIIYTRNGSGENTASGAFSLSDGGGSGESYKNAGTKPKFTFDASRSSSIYGKSSTVQPPAYIVNVWRRTA